MKSTPNLTATCAMTNEMSDERNPRRSALVKHLELTPHPLEGGFFVELHRAKYMIATPERGEDESRHVYTTIFYMLCDEDDAPGLGWLHHNESDATHFFHEGWPMDYLTISPEGEVEVHVLGPVVEEGHKLQLTVPGGYWKASFFHEPADDAQSAYKYVQFKDDQRYGLLSEALAPGFDYRDNELATVEKIKALFGDEVFERVKGLIKPAEESA